MFRWIKRWFSGREGINFTLAPGETRTMEANSSEPWTITNPLDRPVTFGYDPKTKRHVFPDA